ncbi:nitroreductase family protein [Salibacterium qingdaonense]|uniref:Nitroreductase n=1 Tax=Salibacterium qingdaonense TaxID=266892 RepID=A0A1I4L3P0_9BACI|nr:nitroreductase family protein [Salibacterium qingdaonense]SFL85496.1 Nitroreductase [Salibacterium qingdaonense]
MELHEIIQNRREITNFKDTPIPEDSMQKLMDAAALAPAGNNLPSREFIVVRRKETLARLAKTPATVSWVEHAAAAVVVTGRPDVSKYWLQDSSIACGFLWLAAVNEGLGGAFGAVYHAQDAGETEKREAHVRGVLDIPADRHITAILGFGWPVSHPGAKTPPENSELLHDETF